MLKDQEEALIAQQAAEFQAWLHSQPWWPLQPPQAGYSGPLPKVDFPPQMVDEMEAAIAEAFERVLQPKQPGHSGPLIDVFLPSEQVGEMEAAIEEAFEQIEAGDAAARLFD
jgi:hypothetical protein